MIPSDLIEGFRGMPTSIISDNLDRLPGPVGLRPFHSRAPLLGRALTVRTRAGDNLAVHEALEHVKPGDVLVVDGGGDESRALVGEIMKAIAEKRGAVGFVIDGAIRDCDAFAASDFGCYARCAIHRGPYKNGPGELNVPVSIGGAIVMPGDIVVGDLDGIVTFSVDKAEALLRGTKAHLVREEEIMKSIADGTYRGAYGATQSSAGVKA